jgi:hypothetical protein
MNITPWVSRLIRDEILQEWQQIHSHDTAGFGLQLWSSDWFGCRLVDRSFVNLTGINFITRKFITGGERSNEYAWDELTTWNYEKDQNRSGYLIQCNQFMLTEMPADKCLILYSVLAGFSCMANAAMTGKFPLLVKGINPSCNPFRSDYFDSNGFPNEVFRNEAYHAFNNSSQASRQAMNWSKRTWENRGY